MHFYPHVLRELRSAGLSARDSVLVVCGGSFDAQILREAGFADVTISNLDERYDESCAPFKWARLDVEALDLPDASVDWAVCHAGLHHCFSPHAALLEMSRVSRKGVIVIEARDSALIRTAVRLGLTVDYELEAVVLQGYASGGLRNGPIPNYVYRWTEREVVKAIESAYPGRQNTFRFFYGLTVPLQRLSMSGPGKRLLARALGLAASIFQRVLPKQCNLFAFAVLNTGHEKPWMQNGEMRRDYRLGFDPAKYRRGAHSLKRPGTE
jgi:SAM-dependent methyltransferase